jgi:hypothetical protein
MAATGGSLRSGALLTGCKPLRIQQRWRIPTVPAIQPHGDETMWWIVAGFSLTGLLGLEARRFWRDRIDEASGLRRYALYAVGRGDHALRLIEVDVDGRSRRLGETAGAAARDRSTAEGIWQDTHPARIAPSGAIILPFRSGPATTPVPRRRFRR